MANIYSDILAGMMDAFASVISNNLNIQMKRLTIISVMLMLPTLVVSVFGMNVASPLPDGGPGDLVLGHRAAPRRERPDDGRALRMREARPALGPGAGGPSAKATGPGPLERARLDRDRCRSRRAPGASRCPLGRASAEALAPRRCPRARRAR